MITCRELVEFLCDYESGELPEAQRAEFERHLAVCPPCVRYLDSYRTTIVIGKRCCDEASRNLPEMPEALVKAILAARSKS